MKKGIKVPDNTIYVCQGSKCKKRGSKDIRKFLERLADNSNQNIKVLKTGCTDNCKYGPIVCFQPQNSWYEYVDMEKARNIFQESFSKNAAKDEP